MDAEFNLKRAKIALSKDFPFFSDILFFMEIKKDNSIPTICVNTRGNVFYNEKFINSLSVKEIKAVLMHESVHPAWQHLTRGMKKENRGVWNLAVDCHANMMVVKQGMSLPKDVGCVPDIYHDAVNVVQGSWSYKVESVLSKPSEAIYDELMKVMPKGMQDKLKDGFGNPGGLDGHTYEKISKEELDKIDAEWQQRVVNAAERARQAGKLPAGLERMLGDILNPEVDWRNLLYQFLVGGMPSDRTWTRRDRRYAAHGIYMPDQKRESVSIAAFIDTSGSIGDKEISKFKTELIGCKRQFDGMSMSLGFCDDKVYEPLYEFDSVEESDIMSAKPKGHGGTDLRRCVDYVKKKMPDTEVMAILTDGYTPFPTMEDVNGIKVLWLICPNGIKEAPAEAAGEFVFMRGD
jgi:predicted metal-dependent peptidase